MRRDSRLSVALHVLLHMVEAERPLTSEELADGLRMNAVVLRRILSALRGAKILRGEKGHGGGWTLARDLGAVSLGDVLEAVGGASLFTIGPRNDDSRCPIERAADGAIAEVLDEAESLITSRLQAIPVASLLEDARRGLARKDIHDHV
ncbi:MAG: Rrf2 family transcriptional regulator [Deltaproteobacteria bacterium]|nr:Rrf2 family transcriptional regulator [Deltaproteobacteria bacterium]MCW5805716.1 Rrf2 family transcriptional regulator [Deltaproteobacteria bacterium]